MGWRNFGNFNPFLQFSPPLCKMLKGVFSSTVGNTSINGFTALALLILITGTLHILFILGGGMKES